MGWGFFFYQKENTEKAPGTEPNGVMEVLAGISASLAALTLESEKVENKLHGMVLKTDLKDLEASILKNTKLQISEAVDPIKSELCDVRIHLGATDIRVTKLEELLKKGGAGKDMEEIRQMFESLEKDTSKAKGKPGRLGDYERECTMFCGGFKTVTKDNAEKWIYDQLWNLYGPKVVKVFTKGDFRGFLFA